nr:MAG TPA: hypothetical protein [Caudoviricetes sp.]
MLISAIFCIFGRTFHWNTLQRYRNSVIYQTFIQKL